VYGNSGKQKWGNPYYFLNFATSAFALGTTGFDSEINQKVSMSSKETYLVKLGFNFLHGEDNYAMAA
jgi:hypothetical protein